MYNGYTNIFFQRRKFEKIKILNAGTLGIQEMLKQTSHKEGEI
jgi:hypothetical protein